MPVKRLNNSLMWVPHILPHGNLDLRLSISIVVADLIMKWYIERNHLNDCRASWSVLLGRSAAAKRLSLKHFLARFVSAFLSIFSLSAFSQSSDMNTAAANNFICDIL